MKNRILAKDKKILLFGDESLQAMIKNEINETQILLHGQVNTEQLSSTDIFKKFEEAIKRNENITIRINCYGGSALDSIVIYDMLKSFNKEVNVIIEGVVSDYSIPIALAGTNIKMTENAFFNIESIKTNCIGSKDDFLSAITKLETTENSLFNAFKNRVSNYFQNSIKGYLNDTNGVWLNAETCKEFNLCDEIILPIKKRQHQKDEKTHAMFISSSDSKQTTVKASDYLKKKLHWTFAQWQENDPKGLEQLSFRFPETFEYLFNAEYCPEKVKNNLNNKTMSNQNKEHWTFAQWQENDPKGLEELQKSNPQKFENLFNTQYYDGKSNEYPSTLPQDRKNWTFAEWQKKDPEGLSDLYKNHYEFVNNLK